MLLHKIILLENENQSSIIFEAINTLLYYNMTATDRFLSCVFLMTFSQGSYINISRAFRPLQPYLTIQVQHDDDLTSKVSKLNSGKLLVFITDIK